jgi:hypothetical protein
MKRVQLAFKDTCDFHKINLWVYFFGCLTRLMRSRQVNALIGYFLKSAAQFAIFAKILEEEAFP